MSIYDIRDRVQAIREWAAKDAPLTARTLENELHRDVLAAIAARDLFGTHAAECAAVALSTADIEFARWCA